MKTVSVFIVATLLVMVLPVVGAYLYCCFAMRLAQRTINAYCKAYETRKRLQEREKKARQLKEYPIGYH